MKICKFLALPVIIFTMIAGCAGIKQQQKVDAVELVARLTGYNAAYFTLKNNPGYIPKVEAPLRLAIKTAKTEQVDIANLIGDIVAYCNQMALIPQMEPYAKPLEDAVMVFQDIMVIDLTIPENYREAVRYTLAFLEGAASGLEAAKGYVGIEDTISFLKGAASGLEAVEGGQTW